MDKFSVSEASVFKSCPRLYYFKYILGWEPAVKPPWLALGSAYDKLLEHYDVGGLPLAHEELPNLFPDAYDRLNATYILVAYHSKFKEDSLPPIPGGNQYGFGEEFNGNQITGPCSFRATGYMDKISMRGDDVILVERKTTSENIEDNSPYWAKLPLDPQLACYVWHLRSQGKNAGHVVYEVIRKLSTTVNKVFDRKCGTEEYAEKLAAHSEKKTIVARKMIYITQDMCDNWITDHALTYLNVQRCKRHQLEIEAAGYSGEYAWVKQEGSCPSYGGCAFRPVDEGLVTLEGGDYRKSDKWKKQHLTSGQK